MSMGSLTEIHRLLDISRWRYEILVSCQRQTAEVVSVKLSKAVIGITQLPTEAGTLRLEAAECMEGPVKESSEVLVGMFLRTECLGPVCSCASVPKETLGGAS